MITIKKMSYGLLMGVVTLNVIISCALSLEWRHHLEKNKKNEEQIRTLDERIESLEQSLSILKR